MEVRSKEELIEELETFAKYTSQLDIFIGDGYNFGKELDDKEKKKIIQITKRGKFESVFLSTLLKETDLSFLKDMELRGLYANKLSNKGNMIIVDYSEKEKKIILPKRLGEYFNFKIITEQYKNNLFFSGNSRVRISKMPLELKKSSELPSETTETFIIPRTILLNEPASFKFTVAKFGIGFPDTSVRIITPKDKKSIHVSHN